MDTIEISNLSRQLLFREKDIGRFKTEAAKERLKELNPDIKIEIHSQKFQQLPLTLFERADVIAGGLDSLTARLNLNKIAIECNIPYIDGAATGFKGSVQVILSGKSPCLRCFYPVPSVTERILAACSIPGIPRSYEQCIIKASEEYCKDKKIERFERKDIKKIAKIAQKFTKESPDLEEKSFNFVEVDAILKNRIPSILTINSLVASIISHEVLKILHKLKGFDIGEIMNPTYIEYNGEFGIFTPFEIQKSEDCPACGK